MAVNCNTAISLVNISKEYILHHQKPTFIENVLNFHKREKVWALRDINLEISKGQKIGIIGNNGSGKTTLLKIVTGITTPTGGYFKVNGRIAALLDFEAGFHPELTGEENIYLNGLLLGMSNREIKQKFKNIIRFSGITKFIDAPFYTYSSGMRLRLGFSVALHSKPDILLLDEFIAVGDQKFKKKCYRAIRDLCQEGKTIIYISHYLPSIARLCPTTIWLHQGKIRSFDKTRKVISEYKKKN